MSNFLSSRTRPPGTLQHGLYRFKIIIEDNRRIKIMKKLPMTMKLLVTDVQLHIHHFVFSFSTICHRFFSEEEAVNCSTEKGRANFYWLIIKLCGILINKHKSKRHQPASFFKNEGWRH